MSASSASSLLDALASSYDEWKYGLGKNASITRSCSAIVSFLSSCLLIGIVLRSHKRLTTTYHRLLLGMSCADVLYSLGAVTFSAVVPSELDYTVWNARGNLATCNAFGFIQLVGGTAGVLYCCSLNLYYLILIKFNKTDCYIAKRVEPWLHVVPILNALISSIILVAQGGINGTIDGHCGAFAYAPPHCDGYEDGDVPDGFEIPVIGGSLWMIYRSVSKQERKIAQYGAGALGRNFPQQKGNEAAADIEAGGNGGTCTCFIMSAVKRRLGAGGSDRSDNRDSTQSRAVLHRATAYSVSYFLTWIWWIVYMVVKLAGAWPTEVPPPTWTVAFFYVWNFFNPLQGLWTFLIYLHPKVVSAKKSSGGNTSWFGAFWDALRSAVTGRRRSAAREERTQSSRGRNLRDSRRRGCHRDSRRRRGVRSSRCVKKADVVRAALSGPAVGSA